MYNNYFFRLTAILNELNRFFPVQNFKMHFAIEQKVCPGNSIPVFLGR